ncbi:hypothetical protein D3C72_1865240 [compost metagenome]
MGRVVAQRPGGEGFQIRQNSRHHAVQFVTNGGVVEPQRREPFSRQHGVPHLVLRRLRLNRMRDAVHLDDQPSIKTDEIEDIASKRRLPPKMKSLGAKQLQLHPQARFRRRQRLSHGAGLGDDRHVLKPSPPGRRCAPSTLPMKGREKVVWP